MPPITLCVINLKGGVGKSTISALLGRRAFARRGKDVLLVDLDPQANLSQALLHERYSDVLDGSEPSIVDIFNDYLPPSKTSSSTSQLNGEDFGVEIASIDERSLQLIPSRFDFSDNLTDAIRPDPKILARFLSKNFRDKDLIIIDCAPTESVLTQAAYHASSKVLVPVKPEYFATIGFPLLQESLINFKRKNRSHQIDVVGAVINNGFYDGGNNGGPEKARAMEQIRDEVNANGWNIFKNEIPFSRGFPKMMRGDYNYSGNATNFSLFADEFFRRVGL